MQAISVNEAGYYTSTFLITGNTGEREQARGGTFYEALRAGDARTVQRLLASLELEWWFHGPPCEQHLMKLLTGATPTKESFVFIPRSLWKAKVRKGPMKRTNVGSMFGPSRTAR